MRSRRCANNGSRSSTADGRRTLLLHGLAASAGWVLPGPLRAAAAGLPMSAAPFELRIGRFRFVAEAGLALKGRSQGMYRADAGTTAIAPGGAEAWWAARIEALRRGKPPPGAADVVIRQFTLAPGVPAVLHHASADTARLQTVLAMKAFDDHVLHVARQTEVAGVADIEKLVRAVVEAYVPAGREGFDIGHGCLTAGPATNEEAQLRLVHATLPDLVIDVDTRTVRAPQKTDPLQDVDHDRQLFASGGGSLTVLRNQPRSAAGLAGMEGRLLLKDPSSRTGGGSLLRFSWRHPGVPGQALAPAVNLVATARPPDQATLEAAWERLLGSLQTLPLATRR